MALTEMEIRNAKPGAKIIKLSDGGGLQLWISPDGAKRWRLAYRFNEAQKTLAIGVYPAVSLKDAREAREGAKRLLAEGQDPALAKKQAKAAKVAASANTFAALAEEFLAKKRREGKAENTLGKLDWLLGLAMDDLGAAPFRKSLRRKCWPCCGVLRRADNWRQQGGCAPISAASFATPSLQARPKTIRPSRFAAPSLFPRPNTGRRSSSPSPSAPCCVRLTIMRERPRSAPPSN